MHVDGPVHVHRSSPDTHTHTQTTHTNTLFLFFVPKNERTAHGQHKHRCHPTLPHPSHTQTQKHKGNGCNFFLYYAVYSSAYPKTA